MAATLKFGVRGAETFHTFVSVMERCHGAGTTPRWGPLVPTYAKKLRRAATALRMKACVRLPYCACEYIERGSSGESVVRRGVSPSSSFSTQSPALSL